MSLIKEIAAPGKYQDNHAISDVVNYIMQPRKIIGDFYEGMHIDKTNIAESMISVSEAFHKNSGIRLRHFVVSFCPWEVKTLGIYVCIGHEICKYIGQEYQVIYALHQDTDYHHFHFVFNAVSFIDGHRYRGSRKEYYNLINHVGRVLRAYGIRELKPVSYMPNPQYPYE